MSVTRGQIREHNAQLRRQELYEQRYARQLLSVLSSQYYKSARNYADGGDGLSVVLPEDYGSVYRKLYTTCMVGEATLLWERNVKPLTSEQKDLIDGLTSLLSQGLDLDGIIRIWRQMSANYIQLSIMTRLNNVADTTRKAIRNIIERSIEEGKGAEDIAREIRKQSRGNINKNRSRLIARTETMNAMNKGRRMSMFSSNLLWDKKWIASKDDRTRLPHLHMNLEGYFPLEQPYFVNGEYLDYPGDPHGSAGNVIQCRCTEIYQVRRDASGRPMRKV